MEASTVVGMGPHAAFATALLRPRPRPPCRPCPRGSLRDIGLDETTTSDLGVKAEANPTGWTNPIRLTARQYERVYTKALEGHDRRAFYSWSLNPSRKAAGGGASAPSTGWTSIAAKSRL